MKQFGKKLTTLAKFLAKNSCNPVLWKKFCFSLAKNGVRPTLAKVKDRLFPRYLENPTFFQENHQEKLPELHIDETNPNRLILVTHDLRRGGAPCAFFDLAQVLASEYSMQIQLLALQPGPMQETFESIGCQVHFLHLSFPLTKDEQFSELVLKLLDNLAMHGFKRALCNTTISGKITQIVKQHGIYVISLVHEMPKLIAQMELENNARNLALYSDAIVFACRSVRDAFPYQKELQGKKVALIAQGSHMPLFSGDKASFRQKLRHDLDLPEDAFLVLGCGLAEPRKGTDLFVDTLLKMIQSQKAKKVYFVWIGGFCDPNLEKTVDELVNTYQLQEHFLSLGFQKDPKPYFLGADLFFLSSREDPFPTVVLEAMRLGLPCLAFKGSGGTEEMLDQGRGLLVPYLDTQAAATAIRDFADSSPEKIQHRAQQAQDYAAQFTPQKHALELLKLFPDGFLQYLLDTPLPTPLPQKKQVVPHSENTTPPQVSIVMTNYNYAEWMKEAIDSVLLQTFPHWELIIVDDGSKDHSVAVAEAYVARDKRIRLVQHSDNGNHGLPASVKLGVAEAKAPYVAFLEADDRWKPVHLEQMLYPAKATPYVGILSCHCEVYGQSHRKAEVQQYVKKIHDLWMTRTYSSFEKRFLFLYKQNMIPSFSLVMAKTDFLRRCDFDTPIPPWLDYWLWAQILWMGGYLFLPEELTLWRLHEHSYNTTAQVLTEQDLREYQKKIRAKVREQVFSGQSKKLKLEFVLCQMANVALSLFGDRLVRKFFASSMGQKKFHHVDALCDSLYTPLQKALQTVLQESPEKKPILFCIHELSLTGAPLVTLDAARILQKHGYSPIFLTFRGGGVAEILQKEHILCVIDPRLESCTELSPQTRDLFNRFEKIILSSLAVGPVLRFLRNTTPKKYWWIHETREGFFYLGNGISLTEAFQAVHAVWLVSPLCKKHTLDFCPEDKTTLLCYGIPDSKTNHPAQAAKPAAKIRFLMTGSLIPRKEPILYVQAIQSLSSDDREKAEFLLVGDPYSPDPFPGYTAALHDALKANPFVEQRPALAHSDYLDLLARCDVLVCPSSDDPMPVVVSEALAMGKLAICSDAIGQAEILLNGRDILTFPSGSVHDLAEAIQSILHNPAKAQKFAVPARNAYEKSFSLQIFEDRLLDALKEETLSC